ncbi:MAG TPA: NAD(P)-dependent oxidoreductase [Streptosporangiaceae bacterium]|nr:NAD(P)-dependent oxidoreductase [Streptosporangiaceae bacterium]
MRLLFAREHVSTDLSWDGVAPLLPGWQLATCPPGAIAEHAVGADVLCPLGVPVDTQTIKAGTFGLIQQFGVGLDGVDVAAATELGVWVSRVPGDIGGNADSVAELAVLHLLALSRRLDESRAALAQGRWTDRPTGRSLLDATVLIVGLGAIGGAVARRLVPFGPRLLGVRARAGRGGPPEVADVGGPDRLPELLGQADAVVCCAELHAGNAGLFGAAQFAAMKPGAMFVNVARGGLVDEHALLAALDSGQVGGAGLDVFTREPAGPDDPLVGHPRVLATPHTGWLTGMMFDRTAQAFAQSILRWADGGAPRWAVNAPAFRRSRP